MLVQLTIRNLAIIDHLALTWSSGLNVLTGETGAGKSIIVDALGALLGDRLGPEHMKRPESRASVEAVFDVNVGDEGMAELRELLDERGVLDDERQVILSREVSSADGRTVARINGHAVPLGFLAEAASRLIDIHGQSQHLSLMRAREHLGFLDRYGDLVDRRLELSRLSAEWRAVERERQELASAERQARREEELLRHEVQEIEAAAPSEEEEQLLVQTRARLRNVERLRAAVGAAYRALQGSDEQSGATELLQQAVAAAAEVQKLDSAAELGLPGLEEAGALAEEAVRALSSYLASVEADPAELERTEERLWALADIKRKYGDTIGDVLRYLDNARAKLAGLENREARLEELRERAGRLRQDVGILAGELSRARRRAADELSKAVERELADLGLAAARFAASFQHHPDEDGVPVEDEQGQVSLLACDSGGVDRVEFLISTNPGEEPRPLSRVASGGELARMSLALKAVLVRVDQRSVLVFDEIDVGVGARGGTVVGQKLWTLSRHHQVLCVTHLPQVAAFADLHVAVAKHVSDGQTSVVADAIEHDARVDELAAMLAGSASSDAARDSARELLARSREAQAG